MLEKITDTCNYVVDSAQHVSIDYDKLNEFASSIKSVKMENWLASSPCELLDLDINIIINFLLYFESIDCCFFGENKWNIDTEYGNLDGSIALMYKLLNYIKNNGSDFSLISLDDFKDILKGEGEIPLINERYNTVREISCIVNEKMNGNFYEAVKNIDSDLELFNLIISYFPSFKDERVYKGKTIYFYKLAQLLTSDILHIKELLEGRSVDYSHLVGCADYKIPQVLRGLGIIVYDDELSSLVDNRVEIKENSEYEVEIRACMIKVVVMIREILGSEYNMIDINDYIYIQKKNKDLVKLPYHLTRTMSY